MSLKQTTQTAIVALLQELYDQLSEASDTVSLAHHYIDLDNPQTAHGTLLGVEAQINQVTALFNAILTLFRSQQPTL